MQNINGYFGTLELWKIEMDFVIFLSAWQYAKYDESSKWTNWIETIMWRENESPWIPTVHWGKNADFVLKLKATRAFEPSTIIFPFLLVHEK